MKGRVITFWLLFGGTLLATLSVNSFFGLLLTKREPFLAMIAGVNSAIYFLGLAEKRSDLRKRYSHLLVGSFFSYVLSIYQVLVLFSIWLEGLLTSTCLLVFDEVNLPLIISGFALSFLFDFAKRQFETNNL
ncbi:hypothetical protein BG32_12945 [Mesotoga sp. HF07.pep.5.2.highcov]|jgi:hypothetical protein|uniref:hypothetical protein n=1 Tax=unclassified Mesotoga TaxID=1184398 RepID=UPI000C1A7872|nr:MULTISPECIES: hypothetical protein [unclassified Mesotoga]PIJ63389.1 hypothetical protein V513_01780 [Mesotoga sp. H07.pep.5.3]RLL85800.1 hypothetical protein Y696_05960 [Mesotoga sp. H07pep.5.4]RLL92591.1 hypothetical protein BG32_12945 [Mesotoga sp. HF07.pep.5.2.highcov]